MKFSDRESIPRALEPDQQHENSDEGGRDPFNEPWRGHVTWPMYQTSNLNIRPWITISSENFSTIMNFSIFIINDSSIVEMTFKNII